MYFYQLPFNQSSYLLDLSYQKMNSNDVLYLLDNGDLNFYLKHKPYSFKKIIVEKHVYTVDDFKNRLQKLEKNKRYFLLFSTNLLMLVCYLYKPYKPVPIRFYQVI